MELYVDSSQYFSETVLADDNGRCWRIQAMANDGGYGTGGRRGRGLRARRTHAIIHISSHNIGLLI